jgi:hypothetical protein
VTLKSPEKVVADALVSDPSVAAIMGTRIYPVLAPATAALPFATWRRQAVVRESTLGNQPGGIVTVTLALELYAETYEAVRALADACRRKLDGWGSSVASSISVRHVALQNEADGFIQLAGGDLPPVYAVTQTYTILWQES